METYGCIISTVATDALVLKHQALSIHSECWSSVYCIEPFAYNDILYLQQTTPETEIIFWKKKYNNNDPVVQGLNKWLTLWGLYK